MDKIVDVFKIKNKCFVITGASSGIGQACAVLLSKFETRLVLIARNKERLEETKSLLEGDNHIYYSYDLSQVEYLSDFMKENFKNVSIHGVIHAAGISPTLPFLYSNTNKLDDTLKINVSAPFELTRLFVKFSKSDLESVIFISSILGSVGEKAKSMYALTKGALIAGTKSLAIELAHKNIRVNTISPGVVNTPLTENSEYRKSDVAMSEILKKHPLGLGEPTDIANAALFLLSEQSRWITGTDLIIDGGYTAR
ncbi:MAG: NAD(P)-dependent dehydrogenase (short-subunit alcohol dehydrogenase family) [Sediminicola sp.]|jgi:NAD(P)-dependent dehydrogenase (short-subunit alcohol dehydrogenase family)|tara:strand:- start:8907 stop:9668 length:762 start_codon:yes stop_codon:yes gene_type:complete